jgi:hypothetical protein
VDAATRLALQVAGKDELQGADRLPAEEQIRRARAKYVSAFVSALLSH